VWPGLQCLVRGENERTIEGRDEGWRIANGRGISDGLAPKHRMAGKRDSLALPCSYVQLSVQEKQTRARERQLVNVLSTSLPSEPVASLPTTHTHTNCFWINLLLP